MLLINRLNRNPITPLRRDLDVRYPRSRSIALELKPEIYVGYAEYYNILNFQIPGEILNLILQHGKINTYPMFFSITWCCYFFALAAGELRHRVYTFL